MWPQCLNRPRPIGSFPVVIPPVRSIAKVSRVWQCNGMHSTIVWHCLYHVRQLRTVRKSVTTESVKTVVQALIASRLDYCNSVFHRISADNLQALQSDLNAGAWLIMQKWKYKHITATLRDVLRLLPVHQPLFTCVYTAAASYLTEMCVPVAASTGHRCLLSAARGDLMVPRTRAITYGSQSFAVSGPCVWNDLPLTLCTSSTSLGQFQSRLKTTLFRLAYHYVTWCFRDCLDR